jgi:hypothetical protein
MNAARKNTSRYERELEVPPETSYLVEDVEELVNDKYELFLRDEPFRIKASDFRPELITGTIGDGVQMLADTYLPQGQIGRDFIGMDVLMTFPLKSSSENPLNFTIKWSDNTQVRLAIVDKRPIVLAEESNTNGRIFTADQIPHDTMIDYLNSLGMPESFWGNDVKEITRDLYGSPDMTMTRATKTTVDLQSTMEIVHEARLTHDIDDKKQLIQELCINVDHLSSDIFTSGNELYLPPQPKFRNMLRFERTADQDGWKFAGAYSGKLGAGELYDELVQIDPKIGIPSSKVLDKALTILSNA